MKKFVDQDFSNLIANNHIEALKASIFNHKIDDSSITAYTYPLDNNEELLIVGKVKDDIEWLDFLECYTQSYPLSNDSMIALLQIKNKKVKNFVLKNLEKYGVTEPIALAIFQLTPKEEIRDFTLIEAICAFSRTYSARVAQKLSLIDDKWGEFYSTSVHSYLGFSA